jgi:hypothetical protein
MAAKIKILKRTIDALKASGSRFVARDTEPFG